MSIDYTNSSIFAYPKPKKEEKKYKPLKGKSIIKQKKQKFLNRLN